MDSIALTDYYGMYGAIEFYQKAKKYTIKPIIGVEIGFVPDYVAAMHQKETGMITLLAETTTGYYNLLKIISKAYDHLLHNKPLVDIPTLETHAQGIICLFGGENSFLARAILNKEEEKKITDILHVLSTLYDRDHFFLDLIAQDYEIITDAKIINTQTEKRAEAHKIACTIHTNFHYINAEDKESYEVALAIKDGKKMYDQDRRKIQGDYHITSEEEIRTLLQHNGYTDEKISKRIAQNQAIADRCEVELRLGLDMLFPEYTPPEDIVALYEKYKNQLTE